MLISWEIELLFTTMYKDGLSNESYTHNIVHIIIESDRFAGLVHSFSLQILNLTLNILEKIKNECLPLKKITQYRVFDRKRLMVVGLLFYVDFRSTITAIL